MFWNWKKKIYQKKNIPKLEKNVRIGRMCDMNCVEDAIFPLTEFCYFKALYLTKDHWITTKTDFL